MAAAQHPLWACPVAVTLLVANCEAEAATVFSGPSGQVTRVLSVGTRTAAMARSWGGLQETTSSWQLQVLQAGSAVHGYMGTVTEVTCGAGGAELAKLPRLYIPTHACRRTLQINNINTAVSHRLL